MPDSTQLDLKQDLETRSYELMTRRKSLFISDIFFSSNKSSSSNSAKTWVRFIELANPFPLIKDSIFL